MAEISPTKVTIGAVLNNNLELFAAKHATDKDLSTEAATRDGWMKIEFDKPFFVRKVLIYYKFYTNWYYPNEGVLIVKVISRIVWIPIAV